MKLLIVSGRNQLKNMKKEVNYTLSVKASIDLRGIAKYTLIKFGTNQSKLYRDSIVSVLEKLSKNTQIGREYIAVKNVIILRYRFKAHTIFFHLIENKIHVVRILANNMDFRKHF